MGATLEDRNLVLDQEGEQIHLGATYSDKWKDDDRALDLYSRADNAPSWRSGKQRL